MAHIHMLEGPVGAGKSTFGAELSIRHNTVLLALDEWMATLFAADRPQMISMQWYLARKDRCIEQIWKVACGLLATGNDVMLELGLIQLQAREQFYNRMDAAGYKFTVYVLDAAKEVRRERVMMRNTDKGKTFSMHVPLEIFEMASDMWDAPLKGECSRRDVRFIS
jgi:predicted kinase